jgi:hypothetical protein
VVSIVRIERPPLYRGGSASKKEGCLSPLIFLRPRVAQEREINRFHPLYPRRADGARGFSL